MNARGCNLDMLGKPMNVHLFIPMSMCAQHAYCHSLLSYGCMCPILLVRMARSIAHVVVVMVFGEVLKRCPSWSFSSHLSRGYRTMMNEYGLNVSP